MQQVYEGFGRFGFTDFVAEKEKQVQRRFRKMHAHEWQKFFTVPKVILTLILILLSSLTCLLPETNFLKYSFATIYILSLIVQFVFMFREQKRQREKLISWNTPFKISNLFVLIMQFTALGFYEEISNAYPFVAATIIVLAIVSYFAEINVMIKISSEQRRLYPEAFATV